MATQDVFDQIATVIDGIVGLNVFPYQPDTITPPTAFLRLPELKEYVRSFNRGHDQYEVEIVILVGQVSDRSGQSRLLDFVASTGTDSIPAAMWTAKQAGTITAAEDTFLREWRRLDRVTLGAGTYYGGIFTVDVIEPGS